MIRSASGLDERTIGYEVMPLSIDSAAPCLIYMPHTALKTELNV
jgi:hypothetical protein